MKDKHVGTFEKDGREEPYLYIDTADGLLTCVQRGTIEFHGGVRGSRMSRRLDHLVLDFDSDKGLDFEAVRKAAFPFCDMLKSIGLDPFPMMTSGKGVPVVTKAEWPEVKDFAHRLAQAVAQSDPENFTAALAKIQRNGGIFVDYLRHQHGAAAAMPTACGPGRRRRSPHRSYGRRWRASLSRLASVSAAELVKRAASNGLAGWGRADQVVPDL